MLRRGFRRCWLAVEGVPEAVHLETGTVSCCRAGGRSAWRATSLCRRSMPARFPARAQRRHRLATMAAGISSGRQPLRPGRRSCRHPAGDAAADRPHPEGIGSGGAALVGGADDAGTARAAAGRHPGRPTPRPHGARPGAAAALAEGPSGGVGWLFALADRQMGAAINAMHAIRRIAGPCRSWRSAPACRDRASPRSSRRRSGDTHGI